MSESAKASSLIESMEWGTAVSLLAGGALVAIGLQKRSALGWTVAALGGGIAAYGFIDRAVEAQPKNVDWVKRCITIADSVENLYDFFSKPDNLVKIFPGVESIEPQPDEHWVWHVALPSGRKFSFRTENVTTERPCFMHWKTTDDEPIDHHGKVEFRQAPGDRGTEIELRLTWRPRGIATQVLASFGLIGKAAAWQGSEVLRRAKQLIETGELSTASMGG